jgi:hypothetical protein
MALEESLHRKSASSLLVRASTQLAPEPFASNESRKGLRYGVGVVGRNDETT